jgi:hypothetical protein
MVTINLTMTQFGACVLSYVVGRFLGVIVTEWWLDRKRGK